MFTPQRKGWSLTPRTAERNGPLAWKGKGVAVGEGAAPPPPPQNSLGENGGGGGGGSAREAEVWRSFREAGMLDDAGFERKDREALLQRVAKLEGELYDYQYNMGLLLIEKKQWTSKYEEFQQGLIDAEEILKREQASHLAAISEIEMREENLKKALGVEKQCVADLEKALREMRAGHAEVKFTSDQKLADANALMANIEDKSLETEAKQRAADARLSELSRKSSEIERKLQELVARESMLQRERASLNIEKELNADELARQRDALQIWQKSLQEGQERLVESQNLLNQRERRSNESDKILTKKEKELDAMRDSIEKTRNSLKEKEDYINLRLTALADKEKEDDRTKECLERKEKELIALEEKLTAREQMEIQKIMDEHSFVLDAKKRTFEMEMETKRKTFDEELQRKLVSVDKREREINYKGEELIKREHTLELKIMKLNDEKKDLDMRSNILKTREDDLKINEMMLEKKSKQLVDDEEEFAVSKAKLEIEWKSVKAEKAHILTQVEILKVTEQERVQHNELQSKLKEEIEECRIVKELITKEREELRQDRENFEREWEVLDEKRSSLSLEAKQVMEEKERLEKWKHSEEERLEDELLATRNNINRELDELKLRKEAFEGKMELERSEIMEKLQQDSQDMARELENKKHELQIEMQKKLEESESRFRLEVAEFSRMRETELGHINSSRDSALLDMQKMKGERDMFEREKQEYISQRKKIEEAQLEIRNDIDSLRSLSRNLKNQREEFVREREHFLILVDKYKICQNCGVTITELAFPFFQSQREIEDPEKALLPSLASDFLEDHFNSGKVEVSPVGDVSLSGASSGRMSWLRSCTNKIFSFSPNKKNEDSSTRKSDGSNLLDCQLNRVESMEVSRDSFDIQRAQSDDQMGVTETSGKNDTVEEVPGSSLRVEDNLSLDVHRTALNNGIGDIESESTIPPVDVQNEIASLPALPEGTSEPETKKKGKRPGKGKSLKRTRSVQAVVEESKFILEKDGNGETTDSLLKNKESQEDISQTDRTVSGLGHKRRFAQTSGSAANELDGDSDAQSDSISKGGHHKRRQIAFQPTQAVGDKRYNLRRSTIAGGQTKGPKNKARSQSPAAEPSHAAVGEVKDTKESELAGAPLGAEGNNEKEVLQRVTTESVVEVNEFSLEKVDEIGEDEDEVNGVEEGNTLVAAEDDGYLTEEAPDVEFEEDSDDGRLNASIGKKIWKFLTS